MSKIKMRCISCGKWFQSANAKEVTCPDCMQKARKEKMAAKITPPPTSKTPGQIGHGSEGPTRSVPPPPKPKPASGGTSHWLDTLNDVKVGQPDQPTRPKLPPSPMPRDNRGGPERGGDRGPTTGGPGGYREGGYRGPGGYRENDYRRPGPYRVGGGMGIPDTVEPRPRQPMTGGPQRGPRPGAPGESRPDKFRPGGKPAGPNEKRAPKPKLETPPKPKREKIPPPAPFVPTAEQVALVEARYKELAIPAEFDGIRTQIAQEINIPKSAVKKIIKDFREREHIPSWWELQTYKGDSEELEKIKAVYEPLLPLPPIGVHKQIAEQLSLKPADVYQAIKTIRQEMNLPQFNDPVLHGLDPDFPKKKSKAEAENTEEATGTEAEEQKGVTQPAEEATQPQVEEPGGEIQPVEQATEHLQAEEQKTEPEQSQTEEKKHESEGEFTSVETDMTFQKVGNSTEVVAAASEPGKDSEA